MTELQKQLIVLELIKHSIDSRITIREIQRPTGVAITLRGLIAFIEKRSSAEHADILYSTFSTYFNDTELNQVVLDLNRPSRNPYSSAYTTDLVHNVLTATPNNIIKSLITNMPFRRNEIERTIRLSFVDHFMAATGVTKTIANYIKIDLSRNTYSINWDTVRNHEELRDAITLYNFKTLEKCLERGVSYPDIGCEKIIIPELKLTLRYNAE